MGGSPQSHKALESAGRIANSSMADLLILNVIDSDNLGITEEVGGRFAFSYPGELEADLIAIGSRGLLGFKRLFLGLVASDVSEKAHCPAFIIR